MSRYNAAMKPVIIFRHVANEGPGTIESFLIKKNIPYTIVKIDQGASPITDIKSCSGLVFMGGPMSVNDDLPWIADSLALIRAALATQLPVMGVCLGGQLIAKAMDAVISQNPLPEFGWLPVATVKTAENIKSRDWLKNIPAKFDAFHWHGETFSLPVDAIPLLTSEACANQGFVSGNTIAMQCHIEMNEALVRDWAANNTDLPPPTDTIQTREAMVTNLDQRLTSLQTVADNLFSRWAVGLNK